MNKYQLTDRTILQSGVMLLTLKPKDSVGTTFLAGQYVSLSFRSHGRPTPARCFSITNYPNQQNILQFAIRQRGKFTRALANLQVGSTLSVGGPFGSFVYDPDFDEKSVMLAGGIGITPIMSIIRSANISKLPGRFDLIYSCRTQDQVLFADELLDIERNYPNIRVILAISDGPIEKLRHKNKVQRRVDQNLIRNVVGGDFENTSFFVCGPESFSRSMVAVLKENDTPDIRINTESFTQVHDLGSQPFGRSLRKVYATSAFAFIAIGTFIAAPDIGHALGSIRLSDDDSSTASSQTTPVSTVTQTQDTSGSQSATAPAVQSQPSTSSNSSTTTTPNRTQMYRAPVSSVS